MSQYTVTNGNNSGSGSLREGLADNTVTEIIFDPLVTLVTLAGMNNELIINRSLTITGSGMGEVEITQTGGPFASNARIFRITNGATVTISGLTISNGTAVPAGAGIQVEASSNLSLDHCIVTDNNITSLNPGSGGGIYITGDSSLTVSYCIISSNSATSGGGIYCNTNCTCIIKNSLFYNNSISTSGSALFFQPSTNGSIYNSTFSNNNGSGGIATNGTVTIINSTIANNITNSSGGGIYQISGTCSIGNCIIANNTSTTTSNDDVFGTFNSLGYNIIGNSNGSSSFTGPGDITDVDPMLGSLGFYGGPTQTISLSEGSPALNAGDYTLLPIDERVWDQRDEPFYRVSNDQIDIGAFEDQSFICYSGKSKVLTRNTLTNVVGELNAEDVVSDLHEVYDVLNQCFIPVKFNIVTRKINRFMLIKTDTIGPGQPFEGFYVTSGHKLLINGKKN